MKRLPNIIPFVILLCMISCHRHIGSKAELALADSLIQEVKVNHSNHPTMLALQYCQRAIDLLPNNDTASLSRKERLYIEMGSLFAKQLLYDEAIDRFHLAYGCATELHDTIIMIDAYKCVGDMYRKKHNLGEAVHFYDLAEQLAIQSKTEKPRISLALRLAATFMEDGKLDLAIEFLPPAPYEVEAVDNDLYNYVMWHVYSFTNRENKDSSEYYLRKLSESPDIYYRKYAVDNEHSAAIAGGDYKKAYWTNHQKTKLEKEMSDSFREEALESLNSMYHTLSMERQNASLQERNQQIKFYAMLAVLLLVLVVAVSAIVIYRIINNRIQLEHTKTIQITEGQMLDNMDLERERGITIKSHAIQMEYEFEGKNYILNLIDTPGHVDFSYEVSRSIAACEGALLVVDATQGVQAQTISNLYMAIDHNLEIIPVINKIDMPSAMPDEVEDEIVELLGCDHEDIIRASGKTGEGVEEILQAVVKRIPHPVGDPKAPLQALIFDSVFNSFRGIIAYFKITNGSIRKGDKVKFFNTGMEYDADEVGVLKMDMIPRQQLNTGEVGYIISGIKDAKEVKVGDTITHIRRLSH